MTRNFQGWDKEAVNRVAKKLPGYQKTAPTPSGRIVAKHFKLKNKTKDQFFKNILDWCEKRNLELLQEYKFHPTRKWRFDRYIPALKIGIEYNGIISAKSRHTTLEGYSADMNKINAAQSLGIKVLQFTPLTVDSLISELNKNV